MGIEEEFSAVIQRYTDNMGEDEIILPLLMDILAKHRQEGLRSIDTAPRDTFLLLRGPSGYTTIPFVYTTGRMCSEYKVGRWIDHRNDDLTDWGFKPTHWMPLPEER